jgi:flagellar biosynthesis protein FliQ
MTPQMALDLTNAAMILAAKLSAPVLLSTIVVGVLVNVLQTVTSLKDQSLTFVPKLAVAGVAMGLALPWMIQLMTSYFHEMFGLFAQVAPR